MIFLVTTASVAENSAFAQSTASGTNSTISYNLPAIGETGGLLQLTADTEGKKQPLQVPINKILFKITPHLEDDGTTVRSLDIDLRPDLMSFYQQIGFFNKLQDTVVVYPIFTQAAYGENGFYDYYNKKCDSRCLTVNIPKQVTGRYASSEGATAILSLLKYAFISDIDVDQNPDILKQYKRVIILHNEYVTKREFEAITAHPNVIYLYPNSLYAEVRVDYYTGTIVLLRGHGYPSQNITNGFGWKFDNSKFESNVQCEHWNFTSINNGNMLNCYPEYRLLYDESLLESLQKNDQSYLANSDCFRYANKSISEHDLISDIGIDANHLPLWIMKMAKWCANGYISGQEFINSIVYLYQNGMID